MKLQLTILLFALSTVTLGAAPDRKPPAAPEVKPEAIVPYIAGPCRFGTIVQDGRKVRIEGIDWYVEDGLISRDGKTLRVLWIERATGRPGIGIYRLAEDRSIIGAWNWAEKVIEDAEGRMDGLTCPETLREPIVPDL